MSATKTRITRCEPSSSSQNELTFSCYYSESMCVTAINSNILQEKLIIKSIVKKKVDQTFYHKRLPHDPIISDVLQITGWAVWGFFVCFLFLWYSYSLFCSYCWSGVFLYFVGVFCLLTKSEKHPAVLLTCFDSSEFQLKSNSCFPAPS